MTAFRTFTDSFVRANAQVLGISVDSFAAAGKRERVEGQHEMLAGKRILGHWLAGAIHQGERRCGVSKFNCHARSVPARRPARLD